MKKLLYTILIILLFTGLAVSQEQTACPVMDGNPINKNIYIEYKGEKVYFCCSHCISPFKADPDKYISKLPQFSNEDDHSGHVHGSENIQKDDQKNIEKKNHSEHMHDDDKGFLSIETFIKPAGILTIISIFITLILGLQMGKNKEVLFPWHRRFAFITGILATIHAILVMLH